MIRIFIYILNILYAPRFLWQVRIIQLFSMLFCNIPVMLLKFYTYEKILTNVLTSVVIIMFDDPFSDDIVEKSHALIENRK